MKRTAGYRLRRALDRAVRPGGRAVVLLYHRIADEDSDPYGLCISPSDFEQHLESVLRAGMPTPLAELSRALHDGRVPDRAICITFDDGYLDNLEHAAPLLERYGVPATIFVTTGAGGRAREFWWDELERVFFQSPRLPAQLELSIDGDACTWRLDGATDYSARERRHHRGWHLGVESAPTARHAVFRDIYFRIRPLSVEGRTAAMDALLAWAAAAPDDVRRTHSVLSPAQVAQITRTGLVQIGAHTVNHPDLSAQDGATQREEVRSSGRELESWLGGRVSGFAYPYGLYDDGAVDAVREAGFDFACSGDWRLVSRRADRYLIPRIEVPTGGGDAIARLLHRWHW